MATVSGDKFFSGGVGKVVFSASDMTPQKEEQQQSYFEKPKPKTFSESIIGKVFYDRANKQSEIFARQAEGKQSGLSTGFQTAVNLASTPVEMATTALGEFAKSVLPQSLKDKTKEALGTVAEKVKALPEVQQFMQNWEDLKRESPEMAANTKALGEAGEYLLNFLGLGKAKQLTETGVKEGANLLQKGVETFGSKAKSVVEDVNATANDLMTKAKTAVGMGPKDPLKTAYDAVTPSARELTPTEYGDLLRKGKISPKSATQEAKYILSDAEKATAQKYAKLLQDGDPIKNGQNLINEIVKMDDDVGKYLATKNTQIWSKKKFSDHLLERLKGIDDVTVPVARLNKAKSDLVKSFVDSLPKNATLADIWKARKEFDAAIEAKLRAFSGSPTLKKDMAKELRNAVQDFIAEATDEPIYKGYMKDMSQLFDLADIVDAKAIKEKGQSSIKAWMKANPSKAKAAKWTLGIIGAGAVTSAAF